jgi:universal stress protein A
MITIRRILVPTDFSDNSLAAVRYAVEIAVRFGSELVLLHVVSDMALVLPDAVMPTPVVTPDLDQLTTNAKTSLTNLIASENLARLNPKAEVRIGAPAVEIDAAAKDLKCDPICVSTHGRTGLSHLLMGSVAEKIVRHAPCPVLIVRPVTK